MISQELKNSLILTVNGKTESLHNVSPTMTLLEYLRQSGRVGTKEGCGDGDCGACTVALIGAGENGKAQFQAVNSCLVPLGSVAEREIITVEGISTGNLHPVQAAMVETGGSQCGYCTPGFIMSMFAAFYDGKIDDAAIEGNLCRCTGYLPIRRAAQKLSDLKPNDFFTGKLAETNFSLTEFQYKNENQLFFRPVRFLDVLELLQQFPAATLVAGSTDLGLEFSWHTGKFPVLISLEAVEELKNITETGEFIEIGAAVNLTRIEKTLRGRFPALDEMLHWFAARQVKNRATIGGNIGTASPIGDLPPVLLSLDAEIKLASTNGERTIPIAGFFKGYRKTDLQAGELIVSVKIPKHISENAARRLSQSYKVGKRGTDDISIVASSFSIDLDAENRVVKARLAYGGVAAIPARAFEAEEFLEGKIWNLETVRSVKNILRNAFTPLTDVRGSAEYRKTLCANLFEKFFVEMEAQQK